MMNKLTITIPSYNRPEKIYTTLRKLYPQLTDSVNIVVLDNASNVEYQMHCSELDPKIQEYILAGKIKFIRHMNNIGMSANFMRCFEVCDSEWMWLLSDDDNISDTAISTILTTINFVENKDGKATFIKFSSERCQEKLGGRFINTLNEIINTLSISVNYFNSFIFLSNGIYHSASFKKQIETGYKYLNTYVPHLMMLLNFLATNRNDEKFYLSDERIVSYIQAEVGYSYGFVAGLGVGAFKNFTFNLPKKQYMKLTNVFAAHNDFKVIIDLFYFARTHANKFVSQILASNYYVQIKSARNLGHRILLKTFMLLLHTPNILDLLIRALSAFSPKFKRHISEIIKRYQN